MKLCGWLIVLALAALSPAPATAKTKGFRQIASGEAAVLSPSEALTALREIVTPAKAPVSIVLVRLLDEQTLAAALASRRKDGSYDASPNVVVSLVDRPYTTIGGQPVFVLAVPPGRYALLGLAGVNHSSGPLLTCLCMGTVTFEAQAGRLTDLGMLLAARDTMPTTIPELASLVRGYNSEIVPPPSVAGLRLPAASAPLPPDLMALGPVPADYSAMDKVPNLLGGSVERLAPVPGVLAYDRDRVIDLKLQGERTGTRR
jgi:hypothetical protein